MSNRAHDPSESIRRRVRNAVRARGEDVQFGLQRYAVERFLYRLGESPHRNRFILKGAALLGLFGGSVYRPTRDIDFTGYGSPNEADVLAAIREICQRSSPEDGLVFDPDTLSAELTRDKTEYGGLRIRLVATLGPSRIPVRLDIGFGDAIEPPPQDSEFPTLLNGPSPKIRTYPPEAVVAEKLHAMVTLGEINSRFKDFHDLHALATQLPFEGSRIARAIAATFERRRTPIAPGLPIALEKSFYEDDARSGQWRAFLSRNAISGVTADFKTVGKLLRNFLVPPWLALAGHQSFVQSWPPAGPWKRLAER